MTRMGESFDHLDVMNSVLSLAYNLESYPHHLYKAGYSISRIEPRFNVDGGVNPDILFMSDERGLFAECKSGEYYIGGNLGRYDHISTRNLVEKGIDIRSESIELDVGIFGKENMESLQEKLEEKGITYPQVIMDGIIQKKYGEDFKDTTLKTLFAEPVEIKGSPLLILKFAEDSPPEKIAPFIFQALMARSISGKIEFTTRELTEEVMTEIWENLDSKLRTTLSGNVGELLRICKNKHLRPYLSKKDEIWEIRINYHWKSRDRFSKDCDLTLKSLSQMTLFDFGVKASRNDGV